MLDCRTVYRENLIKNPESYVKELSSIYCEVNKLTYNVETRFFSNVDNTIQYKLFSSKVIACRCVIIAVPRFVFQSRTF